MGKIKSIIIGLITLNFYLCFNSAVLVCKESSKENTPIQLKIVEVGDPSAPGVTLAAANFHVVWDKAKNLEKMKAFIDAAVAKGVNLLVFPEQILQGYVYAERPVITVEHELFQYQMENAETIPGPATDAITELAAKHNMYITFGMTEKSDSYGAGMAVMFNSIALIGPQGVIGIYRKVHQPGTEYHLFVKGSAFNLYDTPMGKVGLSICYDKVFPETARTYAIKGADMICHSTAWPMSLKPFSIYGVTENQLTGNMCSMLERVRAIENQLWYITADCTGKDPKADWTFWGHSRIIHPTGIVIAEIEHEEGLVIAHGLDIKGEILKTRTRGLNYLFDRAPWMYNELSNEEAMYPPYVPGKPVEVKVRKPSKIELKNEP